MRRIFIGVTGLLLGVAFVLRFVFLPEFKGLKQSPAGTSTSNQVARVRATKASPHTKTSNMQERLHLLEDAGRVPDQADALDWAAAQQATWWGRPIPSADFWKGRVVWCDRSAQAAARQRGRSYPPIPYDDPRFSRCSDTDTILESGGAEGPIISFHASDRENAFWNAYAKEHPKPPEILEARQLEVARQVLGAPRLTNLSAKQATDLQAATRQAALDSGYPSEALTDQALFWNYTLHERREYEKLVNAGWSPSSGAASNLIARSGLDPALISKPITADDQKTADAWKLAYLQRLRRDKIDASYIDAYIKAWKLNPTDVFGP